MYQNHVVSLREHMLSRTGTGMYQDEQIRTQVLVILFPHTF